MQARNFPICEMMWKILELERTEETKAQVFEQSDLVSISIAHGQPNLKEEWNYPSRKEKKKKSAES